MSGSRALVTAKYNTPDNKVQADFRERNRVASSYRGPVYVVEDIYVPCATCHAPVDPVSRVPVGSLYFHPRCLRCSVCNMPAATQAFAEVVGQPVCADCNGRGFRPKRGLVSSTFASASAWSERQAASPSTTQRGHELRQRQLNLLSGDRNILLLEARHGDDPSQRVAWLNPNRRVTSTSSGSRSGTKGSRSQTRESPGNSTGTSTGNRDETPARQLLPSLAAVKSTAQLSGGRR